MAGVMPLRQFREQIAPAIDIVVEFARFGNGRRRNTHISENTEIPFPPPIP